MRRSLASALVIFASLSSTAALASGAWSPAVRIFGIEVLENSNAVRLALRYSLQRRTQTDYLPWFDFNPGSCPRLTTRWDFAGDNGNEDTQFVDVALDVPGRSATEQQQILNEIFAAFATSRNVKLFVRDDSCTAIGGRVASGITVVN